MISPVGEIFHKEYATKFLGLMQPSSLNKDATPAVRFVRLSCSKFLNVKGFCRIHRAARKSSALNMLPCLVMMFGMPGTPGFREFEVAFANAYKVLRQQGKLLSSLLTIGLSNMEDVKPEVVQVAIAQFNELLLLDMVSPKKLLVCMADFMFAERNGSSQLSAQASLFVSSIVFVSLKISL